MTTPLRIHPDVPAHHFDEKEPRQVGVFVVLGPGHTNTQSGNRAGQIKTVRFGPHTQSSMLAPPEWIKRDGSIYGVRAIRLSDDEVRKGSRFLYDIYKEDGRLDDYEQIVAREMAIRRRIEVPEIPDEMLPESVLALRKGTAAANKFQFKPKAAAEPSEKPAVRKASAPKPEPV